MPPDDYTGDCPDLWGVWQNLEAIREKSLSPMFAPWREKFLAGLDQPPAPRPTGDDEQIWEWLMATPRLALDNAFGYVLTEEQRYATRAAQALNAIYTDQSCWLHPESLVMYPHDPADLTTARVTQDCASALSWIWPVADNDVRRDVLELIVERGGRPIYEGALKGCWWGSALNSNWTSIMNSGLGVAALMLQSSDPETAALWLDQARTTIVKMLALAAEEGAGVEGAGYWLGCFGAIQDFTEVLYNVTGEDLYTHPFWHHCSRFLPYLTLPDMSARVNYGDAGYQGMRGSAFFHAVAARVRDPLAQWYGNEILRRYEDANWQNVVYYDPDVPEGDITAEPTCRFFSSVHLASFRSAWDPDAVFMLFKGGSNTWSHCHLDLNSFFITAYGERLATEPGAGHYSIDYWRSIQPVASTAWHNCIVVDGAHQRVAPQYSMSYDLEEGGDCYSRLSDHLSSDGIEMIRGDATSAYGDTLERAWRDIVYLKPDVFVIYDDLVTHPVRAQRNFEWMLHSECPMSDIDSGIEAKGERARLLIQPIFPRDWEHKYIEGKTIPSADNKPLHCVSIRQFWHHKPNSSPNHSPYPHWDPRGDAQPLFPRDYQYLVVLSALPTGAEPRFDAEAIEQHNAKGIYLQSGEEKIVVIFNHGADVIDMGGVQSDAEKIVVRARPSHISWALVRGTLLSYEDHVLFEGQAPTSRTGERSTPG